MSKIYEVPVGVGDRLWLVTCLGIAYKPYEINKCGPYIIDAVHIKEDNKIYYDMHLEANACASMGYYPACYLGHFAFASKEEAEDKLVDLLGMDEDDIADAYEEVFVASGYAK